MFNFEGKTAIITGGLTGIGREVALDFAKAGANVAVLSIDENGIDTFFDGYDGDKSKTKFYFCNVTDFDRCKEVCDEVKADFGAIDILVNNAGITKDGLMVRMDKGAFDAVVDVNLTGTFNMTRHAGAIMFKQKSGRIVNISSIVGISGNFGQTNYCASKAGVIGFTKAAAKELGARGVTVNAIAPGFIKTAMTDALDEKIINGILERVSVKRMGTPADISNAVMFLGSDMASYISGEVIKIDGQVAI